MFLIILKYLCWFIIGVAVGMGLVYFTLAAIGRKKWPE